MRKLNAGDAAPNFTIKTDGGGTLSLSDLKGKKVILYFYPKDDTPGCTKQACAFRDTLPDFAKLNAHVIGISKDTPQKHDKFKEKHDLNFPLGSDEDGALCDAYGVWKEKSMYGKTFMGIERTTFLIDENGKIAHIWNKVKVKDHIEDVKNTLESLKQKAA